MDEKPPPVNDSRRRDARRASCEELSRLLAAPDGLRTARLLRLTDTHRDVRESEDSEPASGPRPISIWRPRQQAGELVFERPEPMPLGDHYAARRSIPARKSPARRRILFFGESVAAGYLYAPHLTPATVLETQLRSVDAGYEVVDLARTNETLTHLVTTVERSLQLAPDVLVIFVGNNWNLLETPDVSPYVPSVEARQRYAQALVDGGLAGPPRRAAQELRVKAATAFESIARRLDGIPVILVVPEVNLADWESRQPVPWLPGDGTAQWYEHYRSALTCLASDEWPAARAFAEKMKALDGGTAPTPFRVLARADVGRGRLAEARRSCQAEVDRASYATLAFLDAPRATSDARDAMLSAVARHGWNVVDLPEVFARETTLPGRLLFLDYCHLTSEGMRIAMAEVAEVVGRLEGRDVEATRLRQVEIDIPASVEATACFGAAVHSAHRLLTLDGERPILEYWCRRALEASPGIADAMLDLVTARCSPCPAVLSEAQGRNFDSPYRLLLQHGWRWDFLDAELVETLCRTLEAAGRPVREEVDRLLVDRLAIGPRGAELARPPFLWEPLERFYPEVMDVADVPQWGVLRAPWPRSSFCLVHGGDGGATLDLTARLPAISGFGPRSGDVEVRVNGRQTARIALGETWTRRQVRVDGPWLRRGLNRVTLEWPTLPPAGGEALQAAIRRLEVGQEAGVHPVFGEVASLRALGRPV